MRAGDGALLMRVLEVGVCGTDREISEGSSASPPDGERARARARVARASSSATATASRSGDLVTRDRAPLVRALPRLRRGRTRLVPDGRLQRARHHAARRLRARARGRGPGAADPDPARRSAGSASSPSRRRSASARSGTRGRSAAASRGSSSARSSSAPARSACSRRYLLRLAGIDVWTASLEPSSELVTASGARYVSTSDAPLAELRAETGGFDLVDRGRRPTRR